MENLKINLEKTKKLAKTKLIKKGTYLTLTSALILTSLTSCSPTELSNNSIASENYDKIDSNNDIITGITQELDVPNEDFKLIIEYNCLLENDEEWTVTGNKNLFMKIYTKGLPENKKVYIDNIHIDTSIMAARKAFDGILQDTMDDKIHNSLMVGFPINDDTYYYGINAIEGQNDEFIQGFVHGYNGYHNGEITQKRFLESDYLKEGVFANKITAVCGLLIQDENSNEPYGVDVLSTLRIDFCNKIAFIDHKTGEKYYKIYEINESGEIEIYEEKIGKTKKLN